MPTPLEPIRLFSAAEPREASEIWCKLEYLNPSGSTKDRIAGFILEHARRNGVLSPGQTVIEASSGSTSIAFALACARRGYPFIAVMPAGVSNERVLMIRAYGGEVRFTAREAGVAGSIRESEKIAAQVGGYLPRQFSNPDNPLAQEHGSGREILEQMAERGPIGAVVSGVGTGGTLVGLFSALRTIHPEVIPVLARPVEITETPETECCSFSSQIPGVVEGVSDIFRRADLPGLLTIEVREEQAIDTARRLIARGYPVGPSSGLNYVAALEAARLVRGAVVTVFPDRMERYFTTRMFEPFRTELAASVG